MLSLVFDIIMLKRIVPPSDSLNITMIHICCCIYVYIGYTLLVQRDPSEKNRSADTRSLQRIFDVFESH